jgi:hypothetical protein
MPTENQAENGAAAKGGTFDAIKSKREEGETVGAVKHNCVDRFVITRCNSPPPCLVKIDACWTFCELSSCCVNIGNCGCRFGEKHRKAIMYFASFLSFISLFIGAIAIVGSGTATAEVVEFPWSYGNVKVKYLMDNTTFMALKKRHGIEFEDEEMKVYVGLNAVVVDGRELLTEKVKIALDSFNPKNLSQSESVRYNHLSEEGLSELFKIRSVHWEDQRCNLRFSSELCKNCAAVAMSSTTFAILALITTIPQLQTDLLRAHACNDVRCQKAFGIFTGLWGLFSNMMSLQQFHLACKVDLDRQSGATWNAGIGLQCITIATFLKVFDVLCHAVVPVPKNVEDMAHYYLGRP